MPQTGAPLGTSPLGLGIQQEQDVPPSDLQLSRYIDINTGKYRLRDTSTLYATMPSIRQRVVIILRSMSWPRKIDKTFEVEARQTLEHEMRQMTHVEKSATLDGLTIEPHADGVYQRAQVTVAFTDLQTGEPDKVSRNIY